MSKRSIRSRTMKRLFAALPSVGAVTLLSFALPAQASTTLYWDTNGGTGNGLGATGTGTWNTSTAEWNTDSGGANAAQAWVNANNDDANFTIAGGGTVTLSGTLTARSVTFGASGYVLSGGALNLAGGTGIIDTGGNNVTFTSAVLGSTGFTKNGGGTFFINAGGTNYTGTTTVNGGTLKTIADIIPNASDLVVNSAGTFETGGSFGAENVLTLSGTGTITSTATASYLQVNGSASTSFDGVFTGNAGLVKAGSGTLTLGGNVANTNVIAGGSTTVQVNSGILALNKTGVNAIAGGLVLNGGTARLDQSNQILDTQTVSWVPNVGLGGGTFDLQGNNETISVLGTMNNGTVNGTGTLTFTSINSTTSIVAGTTNTINANVQLTSLPSTGSNNSRNFLVNNGATLSINGVISDAGTSNIAFMSASGSAIGGTGVMKLNGLNTQLGTTSVSGATIEFNTIADVGVACSLGAQTIAGVSTSALQFSNFGGTFRYVGTAPGGHSSNRVAILPNFGSSDLSAIGAIDASGVGLLNFTNSFFVGGGGTGVNARLVLTGTGSGNIEGGNFNIVSLTKMGTGTWSLKGGSGTPNAGQYAGTTNVRDGKLIVTASALSNTAGPLGKATSAVQLGDTTSFAAGGSVAAATTDTIALTGLQTIDGVALSAGQRVLVMNQLDATQAQNGVYIVSAGAWTRATDVDQTSELTYGLQVSVSGGTINGGKVFYMTTPGSLTVGTTKNAWAIDDANPNPQLLTGGAFTIGRDVNVVANGSAGTSTIGGNTADSSTFSGAITLNRDLTVTAVNGGTVNLTNSIANVTGTNTVNITGVGTSNVILNTATANAFAPTLFSVNSGKLSLGANDQIGNATNLTVAGGTFDIGIRSDTVGAVILSSGAITGTTGVLTGSSYDVRSGSSNAILAGGAGVNLTKSTAGAVTLSATNTYGGTTTVNGGALNVTGKIANNGASSVFIADDTDGDTSFNGPTFTRAMAPLSNNYAGIGSTSTGGVTTAASLLAGTNTAGGSETITMTWRTRTISDITTQYTPVISDVLDLSGMTNGGSTTDTFVLQMSYTLSPTVEASAVALDDLFLAYFDGSTWANAGTGTNLGMWTGQMTVGNWGVDTAGDTVWAVLNHNSGFAVVAIVPEPASATLFGLAGLALLHRGRKRIAR